MFSRPTVGRTENPFESDPYAEPSSPPEYKDDDFVSSPAEALPPRPDEFAEEDVGGSFASQQPAQPTQPPGPNERANNWPVCKPFLYHSIKCAPISTDLLIRALFADSFSCPFLQGRH